jgi:LysM domain-containing protein
MGLRDKYNYAVTTAKNLRMNGSADERDGVLHFDGTVNCEAEKNQIFNANRDQLADPNMIKPGQVLKIPQHV